MKDLQLHALLYRSPWQLLWLLMDVMSINTYTGSIITHDVMITSPNIRCGLFQEVIHEGADSRSN